VTPLNAIEWGNYDPQLEWTNPSLGAGFRALEAAGKKSNLLGGWGREVGQSTITKAMHYHWWAPILLS